MNNNQEIVLQHHKKRSINMLSTATKVKGQGVGSAYMEQVGMIKKRLNSIYEVFENKLKFADITHYHTLNVHFFLMTFLAKHFSTNVGYVHLIPESLDGSLDIPIGINYLVRKYLIWFYKRMDHLVVVSPCFIEKLEKYGIPRDKITYIPNYVSKQNFYPVSAEEKKRLREKYGIGLNEFVVVGAGQVQIRKGIQDFVETAKRSKDIYYIWAGGFSFGRITAGFEELKKIMDNPPSNVKFTGILDKGQMNEIYNISDMLFLPSYHELFPMTILEALNCELPILLRDIDIYPDIFYDYYLKGNNVDEFCLKINELKNNKENVEYWKKQTEKCRLLYNEEYVLELWTKFYERCIKN